MLSLFKEKENNHQQPPPTTKQSPNLQKQNSKDPFIDVSFGPRDGDVES